MNSTTRSNTFRIGIAILLVLSIQVAHAESLSNRPAAPRIAGTCEICHGNKGRSSGDIPPITGMSEQVFVKKMMDFRTDRITSTVMGRIAKGYLESDFVNLSRYFSKM